MARNNRELNYDSKVLIKLSREDHEFIRLASAKCGLSMSGFIRDLIDQRKDKYRDYSLTNNKAKQKEYEPLMD